MPFHNQQILLQLNILPIKSKIQAQKIRIPMLKMFMQIMKRPLRKKQAINTIFSNFYKMISFMFLVIYRQELKLLLLI